MTDDLRGTLVLFPCSGAKEGVDGLSGFEARTASSMLTVAGQSLLAEGRRLAAQTPTIDIDGRSPQRFAMNWYTGNPYKVPGFRKEIETLLRADCHCLIVSGAFGIVRPEEPIHSYAGHISASAGVWKTRLGKILDDYVRANKIGRVFAAFSNTYAKVIRAQPWGCGLKEMYWFVPVLPRGEGGAQVKVPSMVGEGLVQLMEADLKPDRRWWRDVG